MRLCYALVWLSVFWIAVLEGDAQLCRTPAWPSVPDFAGASHGPWAIVLRHAFLALRGRVLRLAGVLLLSHALVCSASNAVLYYTLVCSATFRYAAVCPAFLWGALLLLRHTLGHSAVLFFSQTALRYGMCCQAETPLPSLCVGLLQSCLPRSGTGASAAVPPCSHHSDWRLYGRIWFATLLAVFLMHCCTSPQQLHGPPISRTQSSATHSTYLIVGFVRAATADGWYRSRAEAYP